MSERSFKEIAIERWTGKYGLDHQFKKIAAVSAMSAIHDSPNPQLPPDEWPDTDAPDIIRTMCPGFVCEVGCGIGRVSRIFEPERYIGIDISRASIERARFEMPHHRFERTGWGGPYPKADTYLFHTVLLHVPDDELENILEPAIRPGSRIVIAETMDEKFRNIQAGAFNRYPEAYLELIKKFRKTIAKCQRLSSVAHPFVRHYFVAEDIEDTAIERGISDEERGRLVGGTWKEGE